MNTCDQTVKLLDAYVDQELFLNDSLSIEKHLRACKQCESKYNDLIAMRNVLKKTRRYSPSSTLQDRVQEGLKSASQKKIDFRKLFLPQNRFNVALPSFAVGVALTAAIAISINTRPINDDIVDQVVASHIRSMMASHLTDVSSSDKHQIKPWINKVLDYSPPVEELSQSDFRLVGARLDYIDQHKVVALVYQVRKHYINLFIWPVRHKKHDPFKGNQKGYSYIHWTSKQLSYTAITDLARDDLVRFVNTLKSTSAMR